MYVCVCTHDCILGYNHVCQYVNNNDSKHPTTLKFRSLKHACVYIYIYIYIYVNMYIYMCVCVCLIDFIGFAVGVVMCAHTVLHVHVYI